MNDSAYPKAPVPYIRFVIPVLVLLLSAGIADKLFAVVNSQVSSAPAKKVYELKQFSYRSGLSSMVGITGRTCESPITVQVLQDGKPAPGEIIEFSLVSTPSGAEGGSLSATSVKTDSQGQAKVKITLGGREGEYLVRAYLHGSVHDAEPVNTRIQAMTPAWIAFLIFGLIGGLGLFLYGMGLAGDHLQKAAGEHMRVLIGKLTRNRFMAVLVGTVASGILQSSSATTVMLVGFVSATMMTLTQAIGVTMGAKVGVTITVQIIAFDISRYSLLIIGAGVLISMAAGRHEKLKHSGYILFGFGLIFFGLSVMSGSMKPLRGIPEFANLLLKFSSNTALAIAVGAAFTAIIQSSAAVVAICFVLANQGLLSLNTALALAIGASVGTCATALLASFGATRDGKRVAIAHLLFSVTAAFLFYPFLDSFTDLTISFTSAMGSESIVRQIANGFMLFAIISAVVFLPFTGVLEKLTRLLVPPTDQEQPFGPVFINKAGLSVPMLAIEQAHKEVERMAEMLGEFLRDSIPAIIDKNLVKIQDLVSETKKIDVLEKAIRPFLAKLAQKGLSTHDSAMERALIYITEHLEVAGHLLAQEILGPGEKMARLKHSFSADGAGDLRLFHEKLMIKYEKIITAIINSDRSLAEEVLQLSFKENQLERRLRDAHLERLHSGSEETVQSSSFHLSILAGLNGIREKLDGIAEEILREM